MIVYYLLFILLMTFAIVGERITNKSKYQLFIIGGIILILFAGLRNIGVDRDYIAYKGYFDTMPLFENVSSNLIKILTDTKLELTIIIIMSFVKGISQNGMPLVIFFYALLGISIKLYAIPKLTDQILLALLLYFSSIFLLQDMTQIRAGVASGFLLLSINAIFKKDLKKHILLILIATLFHYSAIIFFPFYFFNQKKLNKTLYLSILIVPLFLSATKLQPIDFLMQLDLGIYTEKIRNYSIASSWNNYKINTFNLLILLQIAVNIFFIFFSEKIKDPYVILLVKINCYGIMFFFLFSSMPVLAFRISEVFTIVQIILIPTLYQFIKPKYLAEGLIIVFSFLLFFNQIFLNSIMKEYLLIF